MAELFGKDVRTINEHLKNIYSREELDSVSTIRKFRIVQTEGAREVSREVDFYNLDAVIAVGYLVWSGSMGNGVLQDHTYESDFDWAVKRLKMGDSIKGAGKPD